MRTPGLLSLMAFGIAAVACTGSASARSFQVLHTFGAAGDGREAIGKPVMDDAGNVYGTTAWGGTYNLGTIYKIAPDGSETVLHSFKGGRDGSDPWNLVSDGLGNLYGSTGNGGVGAGTVFKVTPNGKKSVLYAFQFGTDGSGPGPLLRDAAGNLFGTTYTGGDSPKCPNGCGTVYKLAPDGTKTTLRTFRDRRDGAHPSLSFMIADTGDLYGTTMGDARGRGTIFRLSSNGTLTTLYTFQGRWDGIAPGNLVMDSNGALYGTASEGGYWHRAKCPYGTGCGTIFRLTPDGLLTVLHRFAGGTDGARPDSLVLGGDGVLYGTTDAGGGGKCPLGCGMVFSLTTSGQLTVVHSGSQTTGTPGSLAGLGGYLYGTTALNEGSYVSVAFRLRP